MIQEGYNKVRVILSHFKNVPKYFVQYYGTPFKVPTIGRYTVVLSGPQMIEDIRRAGDDELSFREAVAEVSISLYLLFDI